MIEPGTIKPPAWPLRVLRFFLKKEFLEEIEGDMEEIFNENVDQFSASAAKRIYTFEMLKLLRPVLLKNLTQISAFNEYSMFKNYFKISIRGLIKTPVSSFINVVGLSMAIGIAFFSYAFSKFTYSTDQFHQNKNLVYLVTFLANRDGDIQQYGQTPRPLGEMLSDDFAHVEKVCRVEDRNVVVKYNDNVFHERIRYTDPEFLEMFTFPLKWGTSRSLADINSIILSETMSVKYFGEENPIGQSILIKFDDKSGKAFKVTGVAETFPTSRTISFDFLVNRENLRVADPGYDFNDWGKMVNATFIQVADFSNTKSLEKEMDKYRALQNNAVDETWAISSYAFEPLATLHERSEYIKDDISRSSASNYATIIFLVAITVLLLALACLNYINIAIVSVTKRLKEIGVRKSIGATRKKLIIQFLTENLVVTFFALVLGLVLAVTIFIPGFEQMWHFDMGFTLKDTAVWIFMPLIVVLTAVVSGMYPALYISRFDVVKILKGSVQFGKRNPLTKIFLGVQLILACIFITTAVMFTQNTSFLTKRSWGYNQESAFYTEVPNESGYEQLYAEMAQDPNVLSVSGSVHHLGRSNTTVVVRIPGSQYEVDQLSVGAKYFETMELALKQGRVFQDHDKADKQSMVVNESFTKALGLVNPLGEIFRIDSMQFEIVGVVNDFHSYSFDSKVNPTIFIVADQSDYRYLSFRVRPGSEKEAYKKVQGQWAKRFPETPFLGGHQEDVWGNYFTEISIHATVWKVLALIAILLASLGLYGLMSLNVAGRVKEFSIRKVLGAGVYNILTLLAQQYAILFAVALMIGAPVSFVLVKLILESSYKYHMPINYTGVSVAVTILITVLLVTISTQIRKVVNSNPVDGLKVE